MSDLVRILGALRALLGRQRDLRDRLSAVAASLSGAAAQARRAGLSGESVDPQLARSLENAAASCRKAVSKMLVAQAAIDAFFRDSGTGTGTGIQISFPDELGGGNDLHQAFEQADPAPPPTDPPDHDAGLGLAMVAGGVLYRVKRMLRKRRGGGS